MITRRTVLKLLGSIILATNPRIGFSGVPHIPEGQWLSVKEGKIGKIEAGENHPEWLRSGIAYVSERGDWGSGERFKTIDAAMRSGARVIYIAPGVYKR